MTQVCLWPGCKAKLKRATWCNSHWYTLPAEYRLGVRSDPQPAELVQAAQLWIASGCRPPQKFCLRCPAPIVAGSKWAEIGIAWPDILECTNLSALLCTACGEEFRLWVGMRWCEPCQRWVKLTHEPHDDWRAPPRFDSRKAQV